MRNLGVRVLSGTVLLALVLAAIWLRGPLLLALVAIAAVLAAHEFYTIVRRAGYRPWYPAGLALALLFALRSYIAGDFFAGVTYAGPGVAAEVMAVTLVLVLALVRVGAAWARAGEQAARDSAELSGRSPYLVWADLGLTLAGAFYTGGLLGYAPLLASLPEAPTHGDGVAWMLAVLLCTAACDTCAYLVGSLLGRHKMIFAYQPRQNLGGLGRCRAGCSRGCACAVRNPKDPVVGGSNTRFAGLCRCRRRRPLRVTYKASRRCKG